MAGPKKTDTPAFVGFDDFANGWPALDPDVEHHTPDPDRVPRVRRTPVDFRFNRDARDPYYNRRLDVLERSMSRELTSSPERGLPPAGRGVSLSQNFPPRQDFPRTNDSNHTTRQSGAGPSGSSSKRQATLSQLGWTNAQEEDNYYAAGAPNHINQKNSATNADLGAGLADAFAKVHINDESLHYDRAWSVEVGGALGMEDSERVLFEHEQQMIIENFAREKARRIKELLRMEHKLFADSGFMCHTESQLKEMNSRQLQAVFDQVSKVYEPHRKQEEVQDQLKRFQAEETERFRAKRERGTEE